jgi:hypothetical protein
MKFATLKERTVLHTCIMWLYLCFQPFLFSIRGSQKVSKTPVPYRRADWSQGRRYQALSSWGSGEGGGVGQWVKREGQIGSVYN